MKLPLSLLLALVASAALAQNYPAPQEGTWVVRDFKFHTGEVLPELKLHYRTVGDKSGEPVIIMHGTTGSGAGFLDARPSRGSCSGRASRWMRSATTSSCRTRLATAARASRPTD